MNQYVVDAAYVICGLWLVSFVAYGTKHIFDYLHGDKE